jgi:hypothetical protein
MWRAAAPPPPPVRDSHFVPSAVLIVSKVYFVDTGSYFEKEEKMWPSVQGGRGLSLYWAYIVSASWQAPKGSINVFLDVPLDRYQLWERIFFREQNRNSRFLCIAGEYLPNYTVLHSREAYYRHNLRFHTEWQLEISDKYEHKGKGIKPLYWSLVARFSVAY